MIVRSCLDKIVTILGSFRDRVGVILGSSWDHFGIMLGSPQETFRKGFWGNFGETGLGMGWWPCIPFQLRSPTPPPLLLEKQPFQKQKKDSVKRMSLNRAACLRVRTNSHARIRMVMAGILLSGPGPKPRPTQQLKVGHWEMGPVAQSHCVVRAVTLSLSVRGAIRLKFRGPSPEERKQVVVEEILLLFAVKLNPAHIQPLYHQRRLCLQRELV